MCLKIDATNKELSLPFHVYLSRSVPPGCYCPGGNETAWHEINRTTNATICEDAIDLCIEGEPQNCKLHHFAMSLCEMHINVKMIYMYV